MRSTILQGPIGPIHILEASDFARSAVWNVSWYVCL